MKYSLLAFLFLAACSSPRLVIKSQPEKSTVSYFNRNSLSYEVLGQTPLTIDPKTTKLSAAQINDMSVLRVEKPGYVSETILIPADRLKNTEILLDLKQNNQWIKKDSSSISKLAEDMARKLHNINRLTAEQKYGEALEVADQLLKNYPEASIFYDIKGSLHLLRNEKELARQSFQRSLELRPDNIKTRETLERLK